MKFYIAIIQAECHRREKNVHLNSQSSPTRPTPRHTCPVVRLWTQFGPVPDTWQTSSSMCIFGWSGRCFFCSANSSTHADNSREWTVALMMAEQPHGLWHAFILSKPQWKGVPRPPSRQTNRHDAAMDECRLLTVWFLCNQKRCDLIYWLFCYNYLARRQNKLD